MKLKHNASMCVVALKYLHSMARSQIISRSRPYSIMSCFFSKTSFVLCPLQTELKFSEMWQVHSTREK